MSEPTARSAARCHHDTTYCSRCDLLVGLPGLHVVAVVYEDDTGLRVVVESSPQSVECRSCGVIAGESRSSRGRLVDAPCFGRPVELVWRRRTWRGYFDTGGANNGGTEAVNGLIEIPRRSARSFRNLDNYRLRMLLIGGALTHPHLR